MMHEARLSLMKSIQENNLGVGINRLILKDILLAFEQAEIQIIQGYKPEIEKVEEENKEGE